MSQIVVVAAITACPGAEASLAEVLTTLVAPTRLEEGCLRYDLHQDTRNPATLVFLETWESREAHQAHMKTPHFLEARGRQEGLVASRDVKILSQI